jgi:photosystem II stability/assembly factor-like uncharacterized protein
MEPGSTASRLTARKRRAVGLIAISVLALATAGLSWIAPGLHLGESSTSKTAAVYPTMYDFATVSVGWAVVARPIETTVLKTLDGGKHWRLQNRLGGSYSATIQFVDTTRGFVVTGNPNRLYRTTDGGTHWTLAVMPLDRTYGITFSDARHGSSSVPATFVNVRTADGGDTWLRLPDAPKDSYGPVFRGTEAWLGAYATPLGRVHVYNSFDGGLAWSSVEVPVPPAFKPKSSGPQFFTAQVRLMPGAGVAVLLSVGTECQKNTPCVRPDEVQFQSFDNGGTWKGLPPPPAEFGFGDIAYQDSVHWWAIGRGLVFKSSDAGYTWQQIAPMAPAAGQFALHVVDAQHAWAQNSMFMTQEGGGFQLSAVVVTNDGGLSWTRVPQPQLP